MRLAPLLTILLLSACSHVEIDAPSLGPRDVERHAIPLPDEASEPGSPVDPALVRTIATIEAAATQGHADFETQRARAAVAVEKAGNAAAGSELWLTAQQELSALDGTHGLAGRAAADLDALRSIPANAALGNRQAIDAAGARIDALTASEAEAIATLNAKLKS